MPCKIILWLLRWTNSSPQIKTNWQLKIIIDKLKLIITETLPSPKVQVKDNLSQTDQFMMAHNFFSTPMINTYLIFKSQLQAKDFSSLRNLHSKTVLSIKVIYIMTWDKDQVFKSGLIMLNMRENGEKTKQTEEESFGMPMEIFMKVNGKMTKLMAMVFTSM